MAFLFELVVNFGQDRSAAEAAARIAAAHGPLTAGSRQIPLDPPAIRRDLIAYGERFLTLAIIPAGVSHEAGSPPPTLTVGELTDVGRGLYGLLTTLTGYRAACVGWDPETFIDLDELRAEWLDELAAGSLPGLVVESGVLATFPRTSAFVPFAPGFAWIPYTGETRT